MQNIHTPQLVIVEQNLQRVENECSINLIGYEWPTPKQLDFLRQLGQENEFKSNVEPRLDTLTVIQSKIK